MDNNYSSPALFNKLEHDGIGACGTARYNRVGMPPMLAPCRLVLKKGDDPVFVRSGNWLAACAWQDVKRVTMISTIDGNETVMKTLKNKDGIREVNKPTVVHNYNKHMAGVDNWDQKLLCYCYEHKSQKWYQPLFHRVIEIALVNGFIIYKKNNEQSNMTSLEFRESVATQLVQDFVDNTKLGRPAKK